MSESNPDIPSASQTSELHPNDTTKVSNINAVSTESCSDLSVCESDVSEKSKSNVSVSKIARPTGLKLPGAGTSAVTSSSRIARLCNNAGKSSVPSSPGSVTSH
ncbi:hypothetical protein RUM44_008807 [Polyplax serrata]|uniref:Uncharacterized protein n=1 Tax=Polyplax serrata TaxID=468196 RepID=A0ABR1B9A0_POLSC